MKERWKQYTLIGLMITSFLLMFDTKYLRAPGDYLLRFIGLKAWTGDMSGIHLTVVYFGILFFISLFMIEKRIVNTGRMTWKRVLIILVMSMAAYVFLIGTVVQVLMRTSDTIASIEYISDDSHLFFEKNMGQFTDFNVVFELSNKSRDSRAFYVALHSSWRRADGESSIMVLDKTGQPALFKLEGEERKIFELNRDHYRLEDMDCWGNYSTSGVLDELILTDEAGYSVILSQDKSYTLKINK